MNSFDNIMQEDDILQELGLTRDEYTVDVDVINNETGFAVYMDIPVRWWTGGDSFPLYDDDWRPESIHHTNYNPDDPVFSWPREFWADEQEQAIQLHIREVSASEQPGEWHRIPVTWTKFSEFNSPPTALNQLGFDRFDTVTWMQGLEPDKHYQVQLWFDLDGNGVLDPQSRWVRETWYEYSGPEDQIGTLVQGDYYYWQEPDLYSGIHDINTDPEAFDVDIDGDGAMDFFADVELVEVDSGVENINIENIIDILIA